MKTIELFQKIVYDLAQGISTCLPCLGSVGASYVGAGVVLPVVNDPFCAGVTGTGAYHCCVCC
jgi:hypothetical protein